MTDYMAVDTDLPPYFPYPQFLMDMSLSHTAALTYALLLDRAHLSQLNGWTDEAGRVYLIFPVEKIAAALNEKSILSPRWHWELHYGKKGSCKYSKLWTYATVKNILNDTVYLGIVTQNRTGSRSYKDKTMIQKPETEWICHEDAHEAIVDRKLWETVQEKNRAVKQQAANRAAPLPALFTGKLVCADCGHPLVATRETQRRKNGTSKRYVSYICSHFVTTGRSACSWHRIYEISLKTLVLNEIRAHSRAVAQDENAVLDKLRQQILSESAARQEDSRLEISRLRRRIGELEHMTAKLYEDKVSGIINNDTFAVLIQKSEQERLQKLLVCPRVHIRIPPGLGNEAQ